MFFANGVNIKAFIPRYYNKLAKFDPQLSSVPVRKLKSFFDFMVDKNSDIKICVLNTDFLKELGRTFKINVEALRNCFLLYK